MSKLEKCSLYLYIFYSSGKKKNIAKRKHLGVKLKIAKIN